MIPRRRLAILNSLDVELLSNGAVGFARRPQIHNQLDDLYLAGVQYELAAKDAVTERRDARVVFL